MQFIKGMQQQAARFFSENSAALLTAAGVVGTVATGVLAARGGYKANQIIAEAQLRKHAVLEAEAREAGLPEPTELPELGKMELLTLLGPHILLPVLTAGGTITAIIFANRMSAQKAAALAAAYGLAERNLAEYKEKAAEKLSGPKRDQIETELAQDAVNKAPGHNVLVIEDGEALCFDKANGRYFKSTMNAIQAAVNATNSEINNHEHASASFFYEELSLNATTWSDMMGWNRDNMCELIYSTVLTDDGKPCIAIDFKHFPREDYVPKHY